MLKGDVTSLEYKNESVGKDMLDAIPSMKNTKYFENAVFKIVEGKLVYVGENEDEKDWATDGGVDIADAKLEISDILITPSISKIKVDVKLKYQIKDPVTYEYTVTEKSTGTVKFTKTESTSEVTVDGLNKGTEYIVKVKASAPNNEDKTMEKTTQTTNMESPLISSATSEWTKNDINVTITYPNENGLNKEYSLDGNTWQIATNPQVVTITQNCTVYAKVSDEESDVVVTKEIGNIDKQIPNAFTITLTDQTATSFTVNASTTDNLSGINRYEYYIDNVLKYSGTSTTYAATGIDSAIEHNVYVRALDNALNETSSNTINIPVAVSKFTLTATSNNEAMGSVTGGGTYEQGTNVTITATPNEGYQFISWDDGTITATRQITVNSNAKYIAKFEKSLVGYDNPWIPDGFTHTEGTWNEGFVIKDNINGNEFVWVPVKSKSEYKRGVTGDTNDINGTPTDGYYENNSDSTNIAIKASVFAHGGFYIGRYETGLNEEATYSSMPTNETNWQNATPVVKRDARPWNNISQPYAIQISSSIYTGTVKSALMNSYTYDTTLNWILSTGDKTHNDVNKTAISWGNYLASEFAVSPTAKERTYNNRYVPLENNFKIANRNSMLTTGASERNKVKNIYDLAGNFSEWTTEELNGSQKSRIERDYREYPSRRMGTVSYTSSNGSDIGFRIILY